MTQGYFFAATSQSQLYIPAEMLSPQMEVCMDLCSCLKSFNGPHNLLNGAKAICLG